MRSLPIVTPNIYGTDEGKRVQFPRGPAAVTGDDPRNATF